VATRINWQNRDKHRAFLSEGQNYKAWLVKANSLATAADKTNWLLERNEGLSSTHNMLMGMAIECLLKASLIVMGEEVVEEKSGNLYFAKEFKSHKLDVLAEKLEQYGLVFLEEETSLLSKLSVYIEWGARYPIPLSHNGFEPLGTSDKEQGLAVKVYKKTLAFVVTHG